MTSRTLRRRHLFRLLFGSCLVAGAAVGGALWAVRFQPQPEPTPVSASHPSHEGSVRTSSQPARPEDPAALAALRQAAWDRVLARLEAARAAGDRQADACITPLEEFFRQRREGAKPFAQVVLGLRGKWQLVHSKLPWSQQNEHRRYLREQFEQHLFSSTELRREVELSLGNYLLSQQAIENQLLIQVQADLADLPPSVAPTAMSQEQFLREYQRLLRSVASDLSAQLRADLAKEAGSFVGSEVTAAIALRVGAMVLARIGASSGIATAGAGSAWATLGVGLVAAIVVDLGMDWAMKSLGHDTAELIAQKVVATLARMQDLLIEGDAASLSAYARLREMERTDPDDSVRQAARQAAEKIEARGAGHGLRQELHQYNTNRCRVREEALRRMIFPLQK